MNNKSKAEVTLRITVEVVAEDGLSLGCDHWDLPGIAVKNLRHLEPESFVEHLRYSFAKVDEQTQAFYAREARVAAEQAETEFALGPLPSAGRNHGPRK